MAKSALAGAAFATLSVLKATTRPSLTPSNLTHIVSPARYQSQRFPGKPLAILGDKAMIQWVWEVAQQLPDAEVVIATDDDRIEQAARSFGADVARTHSRHQSGTDRIAEVARLRGWSDQDWVINIQGDEPALPLDWLVALQSKLKSSPQTHIATLACANHEARAHHDPNKVKVVLNQSQQALYFSRAAIPYRFEEGGATTSFLHHIGIYGYQVARLLEFSELPPSPLEQLERLEQLRALEAGMTISVVLVDNIDHPGGVDQPEDLQRVAQWLKSRMPSP